MELSNCKGCGAPIRWAVTTKHRSLPLDPDPHPEGNVELQDLEPGIAPVALVHKRGCAPTDRPLYRTHFASCPKAMEFR